MQFFDRAEPGMIAVSVSRVFTEASLAARPFLERCGFEVDYEEFVECRGAQLRRFVMHKHI
jgi:putative acetyltransferase